MKTKFLAVLVSAIMLFALCACDNTPAEGSSSEVFSSASAVTAEEIEQVKQAYIDCAGAADCDQSYVGTVTTVIDGTKTSGTENAVNISTADEDSYEIYTQLIYSNYGIDTRKIYYYKDDAGYYLYEQGNTKYGYTWTMPEGGVSPSEESLKFPLEDISKATSVRNADGGITLSYSGEDEGAFEILSHTFTAGSYFDQNKGNYELYSVILTNKTAEFSVTVDKNMKVTELHILITFTENLHDNGALVGQHEVEIEIDATVNAYGEDADITVPVPEDLDICENIDPSDEA